MAERGIDITGLELSAPSLDYARNKPGTLPIHWVEADVRDFHLHRRFSHIFARGCVFDFILNRTDQEAMLTCVHEHLTDDGWYDHTKQLEIQIAYERWDEPDGELVRQPWQLTLRYTMPQELETLLTIAFRPPSRNAVADSATPINNLRRYSTAAFDPRQRPYAAKRSIKSRWRVLDVNGQIKSSQNVSDDKQSIAKWR